MAKVVCRYCEYESDELDGERAAIKVARAVDRDTNHVSVIRHD